MRDLADESEAFQAAVTAVVQARATGESLAKAKARAFTAVRGKLDEDLLRQRTETLVEGAVEAYERGRAEEMAEYLDLSRFTVYTLRTADGRERMALHPGIPSRIEGKEMALVRWQNKGRKRAPFRIAWMDPGERSSGLWKQSCLGLGDPLDDGTVIGQDRFLEGGALDPVHGLGFQPGSAEAAIAWLLDGEGVVLR